MASLGRDERTEHQRTAHLHTRCAGARQLELIGTGQLGTTLEFRYSMQPGQNPLPVATWIALSLARVTPALIPGIGWLQIDPLQAISFGPVIPPVTGGGGSHFQPLPVSPALVGAHLAAQPLELRGTGIRLGNCVDMLIGR